MPYDLVSIGRISVDIYPEQIGVDIEDVTSFGKYVGGSATNVAIATSRHGNSAALITKTGADPFGNYLRRELEREFGVDTRFVGTHPTLLTPVTFCAIKPPEDFPLYFYRSPSAPDLQITAVDIAKPECAQAIQEARVYWSTCSGLSQEPSRSAHHIAWQLRQRATAVSEPRFTVLDLDYRPRFWAQPSDAREAIREALPYVDVLIGNTQECDIAVGEAPPAAQAERLLDAGAKLAIVKMGSHGVLGMTAHETAYADTVRVDVVNGIGAGDAFGGALVHGLLARWTLTETLHFANAAGATVASRVACSSAMPTTPEVIALLRERGLPVPTGQ